jgi:hypothetical protein
MVGCMDGMWGYVASSACVVVRESREFASSRRASERERERGGARKDDEVLTDFHGREVCKHKYYFDRFFFLRFLENLFGVFRGRKHSWRKKLGTRLSLFFR